MKSLRSIVLGAAAVAMVLMMTAPTWADVAGTQSVGDFLAAYARALNIELPANAGTDTVITALRASGVKVDASIDPAKALTQADVVKMGSSNGVRVTTRTPEKAFTNTEIEQFFVTYGPALSHGSVNSRVDAFGKAAGGGNTRDPREATRHGNKNKHKGKGHKSPGEPNDHDDHGDH